MELDNLAPPPRRRRRWRRGAMIGLPVALVGALGAVAAPQAFANDHCTVDYRVVNSWGSGFQAAVDITAGSQAFDGWTVEWDFPSGTGVSSAWNVDYSVSGGHFTGSDVGWNGSIAAGQTREVFGFIGSGSSDMPTGFAVNGQSCEGDVDPPTEDPELDVSATNLVVDAGATTTLDVGFTAELDGDVTVSTSRSGGSTDLSVAGGSSLTFGPSNWDVPQSVTIAAAEGSEGASASFTVSAAGFDPVEVNVSVPTGPGEISANEERFLELYGQLTGSDSPYLHESGVPFHSVEKLIVEAPDYGHQTTSEAMSYLMWLEASYGQITGDWGPYNQSWETTETYMIPDMNPTNYDPSSPASYAPEADDPSKYPTQLDFDVPVGEDPLAQELEQTYGTNQIYGMHWILDVDNGYGFGECGDGTTEPAYVNTFQRGLHESTWETVTHPSCETFDFGGPNGFLDLFIGDDQYAQQERYTAAPDADARAVQVAWLAEQWAAEQGNAGAITESTEKASKMGDYLRYAFVDKYFKQIGDCVGADSCPGATGKDSFHYLLSWYYSWGAGMNGDWSFRIGGSGIHQGYQNVMAAYALSEDMAPDSPTAAGDWATSLDTQLEFLEWLQAPEGAIAGGATNNWQGNYGTPTSSAEFNGMAYDWQPVWNDPPSNNWFGFQAWGMDDVATYYYHTGDQRAGDLLDDWVAWVLDNSTITTSDWSFPGDLEWSGEPGAGLSVDVVSQSQDPGVAGATAKVLAYYAAATNDTALQQTVSDLLDALWSYNDGVGVARTEQRADYCRFGDEVYIPSGWSGTMPNGDVIEPGVSFIDIRSFMKDFEGWNQVQAYIDGGCTGDAPEFTYHRYWHQVEVATAFSTYADLFE
ncbi:glycoside hydrolase family 48 protein [Glycomyces halotolerans]